MVEKLLSFKWLLFTKLKLHEMAIKSRTQFLDSNSNGSRFISIKSFIAFESVGTSFEASLTLIVNVRLIVKFMLKLNLSQMAKNWKEELSAKVKSAH